MKTEIRTISPEQAKEMLKRNGNNRGLKDTHVKFLANQMKNGSWQFDGQPIRFTEEGRLLDGQHRLNAVVESGTTQEFLVLKGISADAFKVMDTGKNRNVGDIFSIEGINNYVTVSSTCRTLIMFKNNRFYRAFKDQQPSNTDVLNFYNQHPEVSDIVKKCTPLYKEFNHVLPVVLISSCFYIMSEKNTTEAEIFWRKLCTGLDLEQGSPIKYLRDRLIADKISNRKITYREKMALIIKAWNSFRKRETVKFIRWDANVKRFPILI